MCGILAYTLNALKSDDLKTLKRAVACRGPDYHSSVEIKGISFESSVLSLREPFTPQPVSTDSSVFCYNGQIYDLPEGVNDTIFAYELCRRKDFKALMAQEGEFAFVYFDEDTIYFGRDTLGRRSLLYKQTADGELCISSVANGTNADFVECSGGGVVYRYSLTPRLVDQFKVDVPQLSVSRSIDAPNSGTNDETLHRLKMAVRRRLVRPDCQPNIALLFSGGLDCALLASILDDELPDSSCIDLLNVSFENRRTGSLWDTPDRVLAHRTLIELKARSSSTNQDRFRLVEINVPYEEAQEHIPVIRQLMSPCLTVIDLSIAMAFYFASKPQENGSFPKVLFSGLGADELFAGYSRHLTEACKGPEHLASELEKDFTRLPHRNLGRDDRVCSSWGREVRYPFLDRAFVEHAFSIALPNKTNGQITKISLREAAKLQGLAQVAHEKKRAIQFGARSAKMDPGSGKSKGHHALV